MAARGMIGVVVRRWWIAGWLLLSAPVLSQPATSSVESAAPPGTPTSGADSEKLPEVYRSWQTFTTRDGLPHGGLPHNDVLALRVAGDQLWVGTKGGLALREGGVWKSWTEADGLPCAMITAIDIDDRSHDVWLGSWGEGLIRLSGGRFDKFDQLNSGMAGNLVFAVAVVGHHIWAATNGGLISFDTINDAWELHFPQRADRPETVITTLSYDERYLYAAAWCEGLRRFDLQTKRWESVSLPVDAVTDNPVAHDWSPTSGSDTTVAAYAVDGALWWTTQDALVHRDASGRRTTHRIEKSRSSDSLVICLATPTAEAAWLGTRNGLNVLSDRETATWLTYRKGKNGSPARVTASRAGRFLGTRLLRASIPSNQVRCIAFQGEDVWIGTAAGLAHGTDPGPWASLPAARTTAAPTESAAGGNRQPPIDRSSKVAALGEDQAGRTARAVGRTARAVGIEVVNIAVLRPGNKVIAVPGSETPGPKRLGYLDRLAVNLAIEQANAHGGYRGKIPYGLTTGPEGAFSGWGWTTPEDDLSALSQRSDVWGIVGHLGPDSRMTSAAILKSEVPLVNIGIAPATIDERINPWVFRCRGDEPQQLRRLLDHVFDRAGYTHIALLRTPGHESETHIEWWRTHARRRGHPAVADLSFDPRRDDLDSRLSDVRQSGAQVLMTWCDPQLSAVILRRMRAIGMSQMFVGSHQTVSNEFLKLTGGDCGAVIAAWPLASRWNRRAAGRFSQDYADRFHRRPALHAYPLYEAARHLLEAINIAGLNREAVRETLREMSLQSKGEKHCERSPYDTSDIILGYVDGETWKLYTEAAEP